MAPLMRLSRVIPCRRIFSPQFPSSSYLAKTTPYISLYRTYYKSSVDDVDDANHHKSIFEPLDTFPRRHIGPNPKCTTKMLSKIQTDSLDSFVKSVVPCTILSERNLQIEPKDGMSETELLERLREIVKENKILRSYIGTGYYGTKIPEVIKRNILECPEWYTSYTPYQPEISQG